MLTTVLSNVVSSGMLIIHGSRRLSPTRTTRVLNIDQPCIAHLLGSKLLRSRVINDRRQVAMLTLQACVTGHSTKHGRCTRTVGSQTGSVTSTISRITPISRADQGHVHSLITRRHHRTVGTDDTTISPTR